MYILIYTLFILIVLVVSAKRPAAALGFVLCTYGIEQLLQSRDVFFISNSSLVNVVSGVVVLYALISKFMKAKGVFRSYPLEAWLVVFLYFYAAASVVWSPVAEISANNLFHWMPYIVLMVMVAPFLVTNFEDLYESQWFLVILGGILSVLLLFFTNWAYRTIILAGESVQQTVDLRANPLAIANLAGYVMLSAILLNTKQKFKLWHIARWLLVVICLAVAVKTGSRGQFLFMIFTALMFLPVSRPSHQIKRLFPLVAGITFILAVSYWVMGEYIGEDTRWDTNRMGDDLAGRYEAASRLIEQWYSTPQNLLFGLGSSASYDQSVFGFYTHIVPLEILGELGLIGFTMFVTILYLTFRNFRRCLKKIGNNEVKKGVFATISAMVMFEFLLSFKQGSFLGGSIFFSLLVILARLNNITNDKNTINDDYTTVEKDSNDMAKLTKSAGVKLR